MALNMAGALAHVDSISVITWRVYSFMVCSMSAKPIRNVRGSSESSLKKFVLLNVINSIHVCIVPLNIKYY